MYQSQAEKPRWFGMDRDRVVWGLLAAILVLALGLRLWRLGAYGYGNEYYAAAVKSMLQSWHNFFFVAAEPGGSVMVDKPPLGLMLQTMSTLLFGMNGFALALPSAIAGTLSVYIVYLIVKAIFNHHAALASAFFLAVLPGVVWVDRTNLLDSMVMLCCLIAVWLLMNAILLKKWWLLVISFSVIGLGFNIKMMQAFLILPAMAVVYFLSVKDVWWLRVFHLAVASAALLVISFGWIVVVELNPEENRPYVSSTETNSMVELVFGHNGFSRLINVREQKQTGNGDRPGGSLDQQNPPDANLPNPSPNQNGPQNSFGQPRGPGLGEEIGEAGLLRLFRQPLAHQVSWLLGFALVALVGVPFVLNWSLPLKPENQLFLLFGLWLLTEVVFFSVADFFHAYYLLMLGAPIAVMCGIGLWAIIQLWDQESWRGFIAAIVVVVLTVMFNTTVLSSFGDLGQSTKILSGLAAVAVIIALVLCTTRTHCIWRNVALMGVVGFLGSAALLWTMKGIHAEDPDKHLRLVGINSYISINNPFSLTKNEQDLLHFLLENTDPDENLLMVSSSNQAARFVLSTGQAVFTTGGFTGKDPVVTDAEIIEMVRNAEVKFVMPPLQKDQISPPLAKFYQNHCEVRIFGEFPENQPSEKKPQAMLVVLDCRKAVP